MELKPQLIVVGIDPGKQGGIASLYKNGKVCNIEPYSDKALLEWLDFLNDKELAIQNPKKPYFFVEDVTMSMLVGKRNPKSLITQATNYGYIWGAINMAGFDVNYLTPKEWKAEFGLLNKGGTHDQAKAAAIAKAKELFPKANFRKSERARKDHDGMCDAILIAECGRRSVLQIRQGQTSIEFDPNADIV